MVDRALWHDWTLANIPANRLVFLDESGSNAKMYRTYERSVRRERDYVKVPHGHYISVTMVCAVRLSGVFAGHSFIGSMNGERFYDWVKNF